MKKKLFALGGILSVVLVLSGIWAAKAINLTGAEQSIDLTGVSLATDLSMGQMTANSSLIVTGKCLETKIQWVDRRLFTLATVEVTEAIKGEPAQTVTVVLPGGIDSNRKVPIAMTYPGAPQIAPDEEVFLFLTADEAIPNGYAVMGFAQGKYSINEDNAGEKVVARDSAKVRLQKGTGVTRGAVQFTPLAEFKAKVQSYLK
jgi:hypothetical protein